MKSFAGGPECLECDRSFASQRALTQHRRYVHDGETLFGYRLEFPESEISSADRDSESAEDNLEIESKFDEDIPESKSESVESGDSAIENIVDSEPNVSVESSSDSSESWGIILAGAILAGLYFLSRRTDPPAAPENSPPTYPYGTSWGPSRPGG